MNDTTTTPIRVSRETLESVIHGELRSRIISLRYRPGTMIFENELSAEFGVSRTPVSRALVRLAAEGLIVVLPQRGARVSFLSRRGVEEAQAVRESLELTAFAAAAARWDAADPAHRALADEIARIIDGQYRAIEWGDHLAFARADEEWHDAILRFVGNATLMNVVSEMRSRLNRVRFLELEEARHEAPAVAQHEAIFAAIRRRDATETTARLGDHLRMLEPMRDAIFERNKELFE